MHGEQVARLAFESHTQAIEQIEQIVKEEKIDCDFEKIPGYLVQHPADKEKTLEKEHLATNKIGFKTALHQNPPITSNRPGLTLEFPDQAQFHPLKYLSGLLKAILENQGQVYTQTRAKKINPRYVETANGDRIQCKNTIVATNTPIHHTFSIHTKQAPYRTYVIAGKIRTEEVPKGLFWDSGDPSKGNNRPYHYVRTQPLDSTHSLLIIGGEDHKTGQHPDTTKPFEELEKWTATAFPMLKQIDYSWSGQVMEPIDYLGFLGKDPQHENTFLVTGDSGHGITHGTIAAHIFSDAINKKQNKFRDIYAPERKTLSAAKEFLTENFNVAAQYAEWIKAPAQRAIQTIQPSEGDILQYQDRIVAAFRDSNGKIHGFEGICPHLKCIVQYNNAEKTFDCPCHGSRFTGHGVVINGPANSNLSPIQIEQPTKNPHEKNNFKNQQHAKTLKK